MLFLVLISTFNVNAVDIQLSKALPSRFIEQLQGENNDIFSTQNHV